MSRTSADPAAEKQTVSGALRATAAIIWAEADPYTKWQLAYSFALLVVGSVVVALIPFV